MGRTSRKRSTLAGRAVAASVALVLGGGGLVAVNVYASAGEGSGRPSAQDGGRGQGGGSGPPAVSTIDCPEVANGLGDVPRRARGKVDRTLAAMDSQITDAYRRFAENADPARQEDLLGSLRDQRERSLRRINGALQRAGGSAPEGLKGMAPCTMRADDNGGGEGGDGQDGGQDGGQGDNGGQDGGQGGDESGGGQAGNGPVDEDFVDIESVEPNVNTPENGDDASTGKFATQCGVNENGNRNSDNVIAAPGVSNGAHHMHDYVGNQANDAFASDDDLAAGETSCDDQGDRSTYYWPVLRVQNGEDEADANEDGGGNDQNVGKIQTPSEVTLDFVGSPVGEVVEMPRFLRIITGDAKAFTNGDANANASWSCTGFEDRQLKDKYPLCPEGSSVVRSFRFQSCWDGQNTDSANHRTHVAFADESGRCPEGFQAIPQLVQRIVYDVAPERNFAVDAFPEQLHKPITDHGDFINVFDDEVMDEMVSCINEGRECG
ncbi:hypothetical protein DSC45_15120 [Streptomyces sp. YIM 130001]|uniref:DUF1996 domain-containing protein n=1 Tax=Streptomyces sp. YIM 130001 TaxID=2259644 RepID=UPI000E64FE5C|nr:DUF1996 domain-containing protein [Streptomyces sp. YIM 130001]RII17092.1 hypothetical protein DSC45_15120 [Streptomyces sp. YIM 130001]